MGNFLSDRLPETEEVSKEHSALKIHLVLKAIFRHLSSSELRNARLVDRQWNFAAISELTCRPFQPSAVKLFNFSSNQFRDRDYSSYLDFEHKRRNFWTNLYGTGCPILQFRHLHFDHPERIPNFVKILRSPWLSYVTSLTLSMYNHGFQLVVFEWFLPFLPNLQSLSCIIKPSWIYPSLPRNVNVLDLGHARGSGIQINLPIDFLQLKKAEKRDRKLGSKLHSFSVCLGDEVCGFPWELLGSFPRLKDLTVEFSDAEALIKCVKNVRSKKIPPKIESLRITLTHKQNLKVEESEYKGRIFARANAKLCNQFRVRHSLEVVSMIPAANFFDFLGALKETGMKQIKFEIAAPCYRNEDEDEYFREFATYLIPEILFKFPELRDIHLQYLQHYSKTSFPIRILRNRPILNLAHYHPQHSVKQVHFSTIANSVKLDDRCLGIPYLMNVFHQTESVRFMTSWLQDLVELDVETAGWEDCVGVIEIVGANLNYLKKLVFRGLANVVKTRMSCMYFFPQVDLVNFPKNWFYGQPASRPYQGLPGIQSLEVLRVEQFGVLFHPIVSSEVGEKMPRLKLIHLDEEFNNVIPEKSYSSLFEKLGPCGGVTSTWPSSVSHVRILPEADVRQVGTVAQRNKSRRMAKTK